MSLVEQLRQIRKEKHLDYLIKNDMIQHVNKSSGTVDQKQILSNSKISDYEIVIDFTENHLMEYTEEGIPKSCLITHRHMHTILEDSDVKVIFSKTYDIRELLTKRYAKFVFKGQNFYLRPDDQERIDAMKMCLVNTSPKQKPKIKPKADTIMDEILQKK
jgi:hypothetical protein